MDELAESVRKRIVESHFDDKLLMLPSEGGEWVDTIRDAIWEAYLAGRKSVDPKGRGEVGLKDSPGIKIPRRKSRRSR